MTSRKLVTSSVWTGIRTDLLPLVAGKHRAAGQPRPGAWAGGGVDFRVTPGSAQVDDFAAQMDLPGCGTLTIRRNSPVNIVNGSFSFTGSFYASGTFDTRTTASGNEGLASYYIAGCGYVSGGPWSWNASRLNGSQPRILTAEVVATLDSAAAERNAAAFRNRACGSV